VTGSAPTAYDAIVIGAGIGGLVCGCCLAKAGMKVLIVEQHHKPGGYCTSFKRKGFIFDAAAHSFGGYRKGGNMRTVLQMLDLEGRIRIKRTTPSDIVFSPDFKVTFWGDTDKTVRELQNTFPAESENIKRFVQRLTGSHPIDFASLRRLTFANLLDRYFQDHRLKAIISVPVLGNGALPPSLISAFTGTKILAEFILDGGYYPEGAMQALPDELMTKFRELGGDIKLSCLVTGIKVEDNVARGVTTDRDEFISSKYVISNCDARQTFDKLLGRKVVKSEFLDVIDAMVPSLSTFILYLAIDRPFKALPNPGTNVWFLPDYDLEKAYSYAKKGDIDKVKGFMVRFSPDKKTILAYVITAYKTKRYWDAHKAKLTRSFIERIEKYVIPGLSKHVVYREAATPYTSYRYTLNYNGAAYGWASTPAQLFTPELRQKTSIKGVYLAGHWTAQTQGIPGVAYVGLDTAKLILRREKKSLTG
jgi:phytoene dehydrogenase-like protein